MRHVVALVNGIAAQWKKGAFGPNQVPTIVVATGIVNAWERVEVAVLFT